MRRMAGSHQVLFFVIIALTAACIPFCLVINIITDPENSSLYWVHSTSRTQAESSETFTTDDTPASIANMTTTKNTPTFQKAMVDLFVIIGSGSEVRNAKLRHAMRTTFLQDLVEDPSYRVMYRFFVDTNASTALEVERGERNDVVEMDVPTGYAHFAERAFWQLGYAHKNFDFQYLLRIDDDGYLCTYQLLYELKHKAPKEKFFWGKYFCQQHRRLADENFMLFSHDVAEMFVTMQGLLRTGGNQSTFAALFGFWQHFLDLHIWDDRDRIDAQQGYTTAFMHCNVGINGTMHQIVNFCKRHVWAHHVKIPDLMVQVHAMLPNISDNDVEHARRRLVPGKICQGKKGI